MSTNKIRDKKPVMNNFVIKKFLITQNSCNSNHCCIVCAVNFFYWSK